MSLKYTQSNQVINDWLKTQAGEYCLAFLKTLEHELAKKEFIIYDKYQFYEDALRVMHSMFMEQKVMDVINQEHTL